MAGMVSCRAAAAARALEALKVNDALALGCTVKRGVSAGKLGVPGAGVRTVMPLAAEAASALA
jgi:hypothetical protein